MTTVKETTAAHVSVKLPAQRENYGLVANVVCPHCWHSFSPQKILWVAEHTDLIGDSVLGPERHRCFLPSRFTIDGSALDAKGSICKTLACPRCHLPIPRALLQSSPLFISIVGSPASGKTYLLTSMTWSLRKQLQTQFNLTFADADTLANQQLNLCEERLFLTDDPKQPVFLEKTELEGTLYEQINLDGQPVLLPKPFLFALRPSPSHPNAKRIESLARVICLYDNAGEHFQPGADSSTRPGTQHLGKAKTLMFLFDPTQDPRFREKCRAFSDDPQLTGKAKSSRQETLLTEAAQRVRRYANIPPTKRYGRPLIVLVSKSDVWDKLLDVDIQNEPLRAIDGHTLLDTARVEDVSQHLRTLLMQVTPELVSVAEGFCEHVLYVPVSAMGTSPVTMENGGLGVRPADIKPRWVTVPLLYMLSKWTTGYMPTAK